MAVVAAVVAAACGDDSGGGSSAEPLDKLGAGEGELNIIAWAGYAEDGSTDPAVDWVIRSKSRPAEDQREDRQHQRRDGAADEHR